MMMVFSALSALLTFFFLAGGSLLVPLKVEGPAVEGPVVDGPEKACWWLTEVLWWMGQKKACWWLMEVLPWVVSR